MVAAHNPIKPPPQTRTLLIHLPVVVRVWPAAEAARDCHPIRRTDNDDHQAGTIYSTHRSMWRTGGSMVSPAPCLAVTGTGDKDLEAEGKMDKAKGSAHNTAGNVKDAARDTADT